MSKPKHVRACARVLTALCAAGLVRPAELPRGALGPDAKPDAAAFQSALPTMLMSADRAVSQAGVDLARAYMQHGVFPRVSCLAVLVSAAALHLHGASAASRAARLRAGPFPPRPSSPRSIATPLPAPPLRSLSRSSLLVHPPSLPPLFPPLACV